MFLYRYLTGPDDAAFCHKVTAALNRGWLLYGQPTLAYDAEQKRTICGQAITKEVPNQTYGADTDLAAY